MKKNDYLLTGRIYRKCNLLIVILLIMVAACSKQTSSPMIDSKQSFQLALLQGEITCNSSKMGTSRETAWPALQGAYPQSVIYRILISDIEKYNWTQQTIKLSEEGSIDFLNAIQENQDPMSTCPHAFIALIDDSFIYGGIITIPQSARWIKYPVIYIKKETINVILEIRPFHSINVIDADNLDWKIIKDTRIMTIFKDAGKLDY